MKFRVLLKPANLKEERDVKRLDLVEVKSPLDW